MLGVSRVPAGQLQASRGGVPVRPPPGPCDCGQCGGRSHRVHGLREGPLLEGLVPLFPPHAASAGATQGHAEQGQCCHGTTTSLLTLFTTCNQCCWDETNISPLKLKLTNEGLEMGTHACAHKNTSTPSVSA